MVRTLLGPDGQPIRREVLSQEVATPELAGIRRTIDDTVASGLTPERLALILKQSAAGDGRAYLTLAEEMEERYLHYASQLQTRRLAIEGVPVSVEAPKGVPAQIVDFVQELVEDPNFEAACGALTDGIAKGFSAVEIVWEYERRQLRPVKYTWRDPRFFVFDKLSLSELRLATDWHSEGAPIEPAKFLLHLPRSKLGIPLRRGLARPVAWAFLLQSFSIKDWAAFAEIYGVPFRLGKYNSGASDADKRTLLRAVRMIASDAAAIVPSGMEIEFHKIEGQHGAAIFGGLIDYLDKQVSKVVVGQTMTADDGASMAQAKVHNEVRLDIVAADCRQQGQTVNRDLVEMAVAMNFGPQDAYPKASFPVAEPEDVEAITKSVAALVPLGLKVSQREMREKIGLSEPQAGDDLLGAAAEAASARPDAGKAGADKPGADKPGAPAADKGSKPETITAGLAAPAEGHVRGCQCGACIAPARLAAEPAIAVTQGVAELDAVLDDTMADWEEIADPLLGPLLAAARGATSFDEALANLAARGPDGAKLVEALARATAIGRGIGDVRD